MRSTCRGSTVIVAVSLPAPYTMPGTLPSARTRRAAFLLPDSRSCASRMFTSVAVAIIPFPSFLTEKFADRRLFVNGLDRASNQAGNRQHFDFRNLFRSRTERDGVCYNH